MGVALDVNVSQARRQQVRSMSADELLVSIVSSPKVWSLSLFKMSQHLEQRQRLGHLEQRQRQASLVLPLQYIVEPLQHPLSVFQKARRHVLASLSLDACDEMPLLEPADQHPAPSQKLQTSKHPTLPAAPASTPLLSSSLIAPISFFFNLLSQIQPQSLQTRWAYHAKNLAWYTLHNGSCAHLQEAHWGNRRP